MRKIFLIIFTILIVCTQGNAMKVISPYPIVGYGSGGGISSYYNATYDIASADVTANRTAWFSTFNATYDAMLSGSTYNATYAATSNDVAANRDDWFSTYNASYVPYNGATSNVNLGQHNITINGSIQFLERQGIQDLFYVNPVNGDGFTMSYWYDFEAINDDWLVFKKTDGNDASPDGGIAFMMSNYTGYNRTIFKLDSYGNANFTDYNIMTLGNITAPNLCYSNGTNCAATGNGTYPTPGNDTIIEQVNCDGTCTTVIEVEYI